MKKMKIQILLAITLLCNAISMHGMSTAAIKSSILRANQANLKDARTKFTAAYLPASFWSKASSLVAQLWRVLAEPKVHYFRAARIQGETAKQTQQELSKHDSDLEEKKVDLKEPINSDS